MMEEKKSPMPGWRIIRTIGRGSFGTVYEIEKEDEFSEGFRSALKVISIPESSAEIDAYRDDCYDDESLTALYRSRVEDITSELRLLNKLKGCNNIVSYEDHMIVRHDHDPGYDIFIRMELLTPLAKFLDKDFGKNEKDEDAVRKLGTDICSALERCSRYSIIHRDIKPQNIFVNENGDFKLGDFGIAKTSDHTTKATKTGTYGYMAPEVYLGKPYNASVDIYSLGLVLYWMLNERRGPFVPLPPEVPKASQNAEALDRRMHGEPLPAPKNGSEDLKRIVLKACAFDPKGRYSSATEMKQALLQLVVQNTEHGSFSETEELSKISAKAVGEQNSDEDKTISVFSESQMRHNGVLLKQREPQSSPECFDDQRGSEIKIDIKTGNTVIFGHYQQYRFDYVKTDIEWIVLEIQAGKALVISKYVLDAQPLHTSYTDFRWNSSILQKWLNASFVDNAFSNQEASMIAKPKNLKNDATTGMLGSEKVFVLSMYEAQTLFASTKQRQCKATEYAMQKGVVCSKDGYCEWWLRSPGYSSYDTSSIDAVGKIRGCGPSALSKRVGVRPALWLNLESYCNYQQQRRTLYGAALN